MELTVLRVDASRRADFFDLHSEKNGEGWCCCVAWWVPTWDGWGDRTREENRAFRESLFDRGEYDGYLLYRGAEPIGWCQAGPRDRLAKLAAQYGLDPDPGAFAITCFVIAPPWRRKGMARILLSKVAEDLARRGARRIEAFPRRGASAEGEMWTGPEALYHAEGFRCVREDPRRPVFAMDLSSAGARGGDSPDASARRAP